MYKKFLILIALSMITKSNDEVNPTHSHQEQLEKLLKNHKDKEFDQEEASLLFFEAYTSISRDMLKEMFDKDFKEGDQGYFEQLVMVKSYEDRQTFDANYMRKVISGDEILQFILPYLSEVYQGLGDQGVNLDQVEDL